MLLLIFAYMKVGRLFSAYGRFNLVIIYYLIIIGVCYYLFIPNLEILRLDGLADALQRHIPSMKHLWETIRFWPLSIFYVHADAWTSIVLTVAFWSLANEITTFNDAQRIYSYIAAAGSAFGSISAGVILKKFLGKNPDKGLLIFLALTAIVVFVYNLTFKNISGELKKSNVNNNQDKQKAKKRKLSLWESIRIILKSKHLASIACIVVGFNIFINLFENIWKDQVCRYAKVCGDGVLTEVYGDHSMYIGLMVIIFGILAPFIKRKGWKFTASVTPIVALIATVTFCAFLYGYAIQAHFVNDTPLNHANDLLGLTVFFGLLNVVAVKGSKYVLFDTTKEQAYIPLNEEERTDGKAAIDGVGSRLGKGIGGFIMSCPFIGLIHICGSISNSTTYICVFIFMILALWLVAVKNLDTSIKQKTLAS